VTGEIPQPACPLIQQGTSTAHAVAALLAATGNGVNQNPKVSGAARYPLAWQAQDS
jgi:hypothetical protein